MTRETPSLAPDFNFDTYLVVDELETCSVYREADEEPRSCSPNAQEVDVPWQTASVCHVESLPR